MLSKTDWISNKVYESTCFCNALPVRARVGSGTITAIYYYYYYYYYYYCVAVHNLHLHNTQHQPVM